METTEQDDVEVTVNFMQNILDDFSETKLVKASIRANWENYHYCLGRSPSVELSIGKYLTWLITDMPDHFMNLVVCTQLPAEGIDQLIEDALAHFKSLNIKRLSWLAEEGVPADELKKQLIAKGLTFRESFAAEMAVHLMDLQENIIIPNSLTIELVTDAKVLRKWIHIASIGFGVDSDAEEVWFDFFTETAYAHPFRTYLASLNGEPVGTSQLFTSAGVAGIYNVTCLPQARGQGIGSALVLAALQDARALGYRIGILQASTLGYKVYQRLGFQDFGKLSVYLWNQDKY